MPNKIVKILDVVDTRSYEEVGERWVPIKDSGEKNECARCGRLHEVHAHVQLEDGSKAIVGTGCMTKDEVDPVVVKKMVQKAKVTRVLTTKAAYYQKLIDEMEAAWKKVDAMNFPRHSVENADLYDEEDGRLRARRDKYTMGDVYVYDIDPAHLSSEYASVERLQQTWQRKRLQDLGITSEHWSAERELEQVQKKLRRLG